MEWTSSRRRAYTGPSSAGRPNLDYTVAFDEAGSRAYRMMATMLVSSLLKTGFRGEILVFHNHEEAFLSSPRGEVLDQHSWNRLLIDSPLRVRPLERLEVLFPMFLHPRFKFYRGAALLHPCGAHLEPKLEFLTSMYLQRFCENREALVAELANL